MHTNSNLQQICVQCVCLLLKENIWNHREFEEKSISYINYINKLKTRIRVTL